MELCSKCLLPDNYPGIHFGEDGSCNFCKDHSPKEEKSSARRFASEEELTKYLQRYKSPNGKYDVLVPMSGGVDSSVVLIDLVEKYKLKPMAFHNDHGFEDDCATENVRKLCKALNVDLVVWQHDYTFMKKLWKYLNESKVEGLSACYICGNILYLNALELAYRFGIKLVMNGYSKGQAAIIQNKEKGKDLLEKFIEVIRKTGDREFLDQFVEKYGMLSKQQIFDIDKDAEHEIDAEKITVIPFYTFKFNKTDKEALKKICIERFDWKPIKTSYPDRTTNCEMIWLNTYADLKKMGYSVYHDEYSGLIRAGEITREQAMKDLEFNPSEGLVERLANEIGMDLGALEKEEKEENTEKKSLMDINFDF